MTYTVRLDEVSKDDIALAGGKGSNLGELSRAGLPVPPGYVVITRAYDAFVESNNIGDVIVGHASVPPTEDPAAFEEVAGGIRTLFSGGHVPEEMAEEIRAAYQQLGQDAQTPVAVRSSATAEDLAGVLNRGGSDAHLREDEYGVGGLRPVHHLAPGSSGSAGSQGRRRGHQAGTARR